MEEGAFKKGQKTSNRSKEISHNPSFAFQEEEELYQTLTELLGGTETINDQDDPDKSLAINDIIRVCKILLHKFNVNQMRCKA